MKWFCCSDIHGFYNIWMQSLTEADFDVKNENHGLIICGDIFDRGNQPLQVYDFLKSLPKERRILIRGNHEYLLRDLVIRGYALSHDIHNGTADTLCYIAKIITDTEYNKKRFQQLMASNKTVAEVLEDNDYSKIEKRQYKKFHNRKLKEILKWIASDEWVNYYETNKYIFVHSFIPLQIKQPIKFSMSSTQEYNPDWRTATTSEWEEAAWGCPWKLYLDYFEPEIKNGKTLVCGHWHASDFWNNLDLKDKVVAGKLDTYGDNPMYKSDNYPNLIGLDACTVVSHRVNVLVLDETEM